MPIQTLDHLKQHCLHCEGALYFLSSSEVFNEFEPRYLEVRKLEGRLYSNEVVRQLPQVASQHRWAQEWRIRMHSANQLIRYLRKKVESERSFQDLNFSTHQKKLILEVGCGNGWLSNRLSQLPNTHVFGIDINQYELKQATKVFGEQENLTFIYGDIFENVFPVHQFDFVVLGSSIQYFPQTNLLLKQLFQLLKNEGEIHIVDSPFYQLDAIQSAKQRSTDYYKTLGCSEPIQFYHHLCYNDLAPFISQLLYNPDTLINRIKRRLFPRYGFPFFPWIRLTENQREG